MNIVKHMIESASQSSCNNDSIKLALLIEIFAQESDLKMPEAFFEIGIGLRCVVNNINCFLSVEVDNIASDWIKVSNQSMRDKFMSRYIV